MRKLYLKKMYFGVYLCMSRELYRYELYRAINVNNVTMKRSEFTPIVKINEFIYKIPESHISLKLSKQAVVTIHKDNDPFRTNLFSKRREDLVKHLVRFHGYCYSIKSITEYTNEEHSENWYHLGKVCQY